MYMGVSQNWDTILGVPIISIRIRVFFESILGSPILGKYHIYVCIYMRKKMILVLRVQVPTYVVLGMSGVESNCGLGFVEEHMTVEYP